MRNVLILLVLLCNLFASAQELSESEIKRLERLDMVDAFNTAMESNLPITDFREIVKLDKGIGTRKISGSIIRTIGTLSLVLGTTFVIASSNQESSNLVSEFLFVERIFFFSEIKNTFSNLIL